MSTQQGIMLGELNCLEVSWKPKTQVGYITTTQIQFLFS
jgi:hypothetical protein